MQWSILFSERERDLVHLQCAPNWSGFKIKTWDKRNITALHRMKSKEKTLLIYL